MFVHDGENVDRVSPVASSVLLVSEVAVNIVRWEPALLREQRTAVFASRAMRVARALRNRRLVLVIVVIDSSYVPHTFLISLQNRLRL